jgi:uncharacterized protein YjbI with pentapeptide repeats
VKGKKLPMERTEAVSQKIVILGTVILLLWAGIPQVSGFIQADVEKLENTKSCEKCNLRHANFSKANLAQANLSGADLGGANLRGANLSDADLSGAKLEDAVLSDANLKGANLTGADLAGAYLSRTDFSGAKWVNGTICKENSVGKCEK